MPVDPAATSEQTVRTKCGLCPDKTSETVEELLQHYSFMHFREQIEAAYIQQWDECGVCQEKFSLKFNLIKHLGFVHGAVNMEVTATERWICTECQKEFLSDEFLRKHLIKSHLEKEFENRYYVLNEAEEMLCQFCDKTFTYKKNLFCHVGLEHGKLEELRPDYNRAGAEEQLLKCRHCDFGGELGELKAHMAATHIASTGHVDIRPLSGLLELRPVGDVAYSRQHGAEIRKQWKDMVLAGSYIPSQFSGVKRCKWRGCGEVFEDAVEAFKHIRDCHLKLLQGGKRKGEEVEEPVRKRVELEGPKKMGVRQEEPTMKRKREQLEEQMIRRKKLASPGR